ncbi:hypothetical protein D8674_019218 [Pyrus ussuriensis x Pyrus communis]|uniref:Uncharacterized protein n=1 Tax=Pyrus ussuriensis x Pyrus communis TaxID=2448454 RepID=A0A5N5G743_9ROSA|nr:hypothetical protein D8674_019218 [Pyrus ussuriensis x Pyrus communis]
MGNKGRINDCKETCYLKIHREVDSECGEAKKLSYLYGQYHCSSFWDGVQRVGERLILQDGCINFFQKIVKSENLNANVHVLSYCWCGDLIRSAFSPGGLPKLDVHVNEFTFKESISIGDIAKKVESPIDKVQSFKEGLKNCSNDKKILTIYSGDSMGDLPCLLEADIGIVIGSSSSLR